jgi:hypothetical protein
VWHQRQRVFHEFLTTLAGRSTTSPAAMRLTVVSESWRTGMCALCVVA